MRILKKLYNLKRKETEELKEEFIKKQKLRDILREEGDLRENEEYQRTSEEVISLAEKIVNISSLLESATLVEDSELIEQIEIGSVFYMEIETEGDSLEGTENLEYYGTTLNYNLKTNKTTSKGIVTLGGEDITDIKLSIIACNSPLGKFLLGKTEGTYRMVTEEGAEQIIKIRRTTEGE